MVRMVNEVPNGAVNRISSQENRQMVASDTILLINLVILSFIQQTSSILY